MSSLLGALIELQLEAEGLYRDVGYSYRKGLVTSWTQLAVIDSNGY